MDNAIEFANRQGKLELNMRLLTGKKLDLVSAVKYLIGEYVDGKKSPMTYKQFKMYNDPTLNPELYKL